MQARKGELKALEGVLAELFPDAVVVVRPAEQHRQDTRFLAEVRLQQHSFRLEIELLKWSTRARLLDAASLMLIEPGPGPIRVLASPYLSSANQELLREVGARFVDFAGNAWITARGIHVDRRGFPNPARGRRGERDVYSDKASLVLRILMSGAAPLGVRQIAELSGREDGSPLLSAGYVSKIVAELERRGYAFRAGGKIALRHPAELLQDWVVACRSRRKPVSRSYYLGSPGLDELMEQVALAFDARSTDYLLTGHAGASLVDKYAEFDVIDMYVRDESAANDILIGMGARRVERGGNVSVSQPYYKVSAFFGWQSPRDDPCKAVSDVQLYLDLYDYPVRGREQAEHLFERRIRPRFELAGES